MVDQLKADILQGLDAARGIPAWLILSVLLLGPGGSAVLTSTLQGGETASAINQLRQELHHETEERKAFEGKCADERSRLQERLTQYTVDIARQEILLQQVQATQKSLLDQMSIYQNGMTQLVQSIDGKMKAWNGGKGIQSNGG